MNNIKNYIIAALAGLAIFFYMDGCVKKNKLQKAESELSIINLENQRLDSIKNKLGQTVYTQNVVIVEDQEAIKRLTNEKFELKRKNEKKIKEVTFFYESKLSVKADSVFIPYLIKDTGRLSEIKNCDSLKQYIKDSAISVPKKIELDSSRKEYKDGFRFSGTVEKYGFKLDSIGFENTQDVRVVKLKRNVIQFLTFKPRRFEVQVLHSSPYFKVKHQMSVIYVDKKKGKFIVDLLKIGAGIFIGTKI